MIKALLIALLSFNMFLGSGSIQQVNIIREKVSPDNTGTLEKMIVADGSVSMTIDLNRFKSHRSRAKQQQSNELRFDVARDSFFTVVVFNDELRGTLPGKMAIVPKQSADLPSKLNSSYQQLVIENMPYGGQYEFVVRDGKTGFVFFNIEGQQLDYESNAKELSIQTGRLLLSKQFADELGHSSEAGTIVGNISISAVMRPIEITNYVDGEVESDVMPAIGSPEAGTIPGPDVVVGDLYGLAQFGSSNGEYVGLAVGTNSCNFGTVDLEWFALPSNQHPVIPQNMYRMSGGANNDERFEQIGQSSVKHGFTALTQNLCNLGCNGVGGSRLGSGCSDPYSASLNSGPNLGSRAWINPFSGAYPRGDSATPPNTHTGHAHTGPSHRILTQISDLNTSLNAGAKYYAESQYVTSHEYSWCQANPTQCNMYNNVSYRRYNVSGTGSPFSFSPAEETVRTKPAVNAWTGATFVQIQPAPGEDGIGTVAYKVTQTSPGVWHYEYAVYNQNIDRAVQSFGVPIGSAISISNIGFNAPPQHPGWTFDGTVGNTGFSNAPWTQTQTGGFMTWSSETFAQNPNANAIRWGTMYNFRFDSTSPPQSMNATIGFFKTGNPITVQVQGPSDAPAAFVSVSGRITNARGRGLSNARVTITDSNGNSRSTYASAFGYYSFDDVPVGTYTIEAFVRRYVFLPRTVQLNQSQMFNIAAEEEQ